MPQLYVSKPDRKGLRQVPRQLVGYASTTIGVGRSVEVSFPLNQRTFASWVGKAGGWRTVPGCYTLGAGASSRSLDRHVVLARGKACDRGRQRLGRRGDVDLPLPPVASVKRLRG